MFSRNPVVLLWNSGSNIIVTKENFEQELDWQIMYVNVDRDQAIDIIFDVADSLEESEVNEFYGGISAN